VKDNNWLAANHILNTELIYRSCILVGKPDGKRPLGKPRSRWVDIIKMDLGEI
jgi:hypothetical protein